MSLEKDEKYYTPEIEEFYVGFEYEWKRDSDKTPWTKSIMTRDNSPVFDRDAERMNDYRVKYLDRDDLLSLGFKPDASYRENCREYIKPGLKLRRFLDSRIIDICIDEEYYRKTKQKPPREYIQVTQMEIKNKSELKRILKMLGL